MHGEEIWRVLDQVTGEILERMRQSGFYHLGRLRYDPLVWDINNGHCDAWADLAAERLHEGAFSTWVDPYHCVLVFDGKFYDADCPEGAAHWDQLPMFARPPIERPEP